MAAERIIRKYNFGDIIGNSAKLSETIQIAQKASKCQANVLICGETGTGKELIAQSIHFGGERRKKPFIAQNCAAIPPGLFEGILFGTEIGGFTNAIDRAGIFEQADGGTLLLDEISAMPYELQGKLLRVLQDDSVRRLGGLKDITIDVRVIAVINEDANKLIKSGRLRQDLYYRLKVIEIKVPPLRERREDILPLAEHFIEKYSAKYQKNILALSSEAKRGLQDYDYPGNVRELENIIKAGISLADGNSILTEDNLFRE